jgi:hypothetical protein
VKRTGLCILIVAHWGAMSEGHGGGRTSLRCFVGKTCAMPF